MAGSPHEGQSGVRQEVSLSLALIFSQAGAAIALVTFAREGANKRELEVVKGEYLEILNMERKWWKVRNRTQEVRWSAEISTSDNSVILTRLVLFPTQSSGC